jgi:hypothetical protein
MISLLIGIIFLLVGINHNPQGEFYNIDAGKIDIIYSIMVFCSWFIAFFIIIMAIGLSGLMVFLSMDFLLRKYRR